MTVDDDGMLWVALGRAGAVHRYRPDGTLDGVVEVPTTNPTSVAFGGADGGDLYITTSWVDCEQRADQPLAGAIFRCRPGVTGAALPRLTRPAAAPTTVHREKGHPMIERMVIFGASGDLTSRLLMPAVAQLAEAGLLPPGLTIVGAANTDWSTEDFREHIAAELDKHASVPPATRDAWSGCSASSPPTSPSAEDVRRVIGDDHPDTLVYLALPPVPAAPVLPALATAGWRTADAVAIEKPFGTDLASAQDLNEILRLRLPEPTIFRIDHFLSSDLVRRVVTLRFLNRVFEPLLNAAHVESVDISWLESLTLEGRASYYDGAGAMKDMVQNHLMEAMALVLMEQPARIDAQSFRDVRVEALRAVATPTGGADAPRHGPRPLHRGRDRGPRRSLRTSTNPGVDPSRNTETYAVTDPGRQQPPVGGGALHPALRQGPGRRTPPRSPSTSGPCPSYLTDQWPGVEPNVLRLGLTEPYVRLATTLNGPERTAETRQLETRSTPPRFAAYAHLVHEMLQSDPMLFIRGDEAEEAWRIVDPVMRGLGRRRGPDAGVHGRAGATDARNLTNTSQAHKSGPGNATSR